MSAALDEVVGEDHQSDGLRHKHHHHAEDDHVDRFEGFRQRVLLALFHDEGVVFGGKHPAAEAVGCAGFGGDEDGETDEAEDGEFSEGRVHDVQCDRVVVFVEFLPQTLFAVLEEDPYEVDPVTLKDIGVWGTVLGGRHVPASSG